MEIISRTQRRRGGIKSLPQGRVIAGTSVEVSMMGSKKLCKGAENPEFVTIFKSTRLDISNMPMAWLISIIIIDYIYS